MNHILVAIDFSDCAQTVARRGAELARETGARPFLLHVVSPPQVPPETVLPITEGTTTRELTVEAYLRESAERRLARYAEAFAESGGTAPSLRVRFGPAAETIVDEARELGARMIVVGTRARTGLARMIHGSVAEEVVRSADVPVTTVRSHWAPGCKTRSCNWCVDAPSPEEARVADEQYG